MRMCALHSNMEDRRLGDFGDDTACQACHCSLDRRYEGLISLWHVIILQIIGSDPLDPLPLPSLGFTLPFAALYTDPIPQDVSVLAPPRQETVGTTGRHYSVNFRGGKQHLWHV